MKPMDTKIIAFYTENLARHFRELCDCRNMVETEISELTRRNDDITHRMERSDCKYKERARLATQLANIRRERRVLKDWLRANKPYFDYIGSVNGEKAQNMLSNLVGIGRRVEGMKVTTNSCDS